MSVSKKRIQTDRAPAAVGPYSQAVAAAGLLFASGQIPLVPGSGAIVEGGIQAQTRQALDNLQAVLAEAGVTVEDVVRVDVFLQDMADFAAMNEVYASVFTGEIKPARQAVEVARLPKDVLVEISCIAVMG